MTHRMESRSPLLLPAIVFLLVMGMIEGVILAYKGSLEAEQRLQAVAFGTDVRSRAERELTSVLNLTSGLASYFSVAVRRDSLEREEVLDILSVAYETSPMVRNFGVAEGYKLSYVYPTEGNEEAIGLDYRELEAQWPAVQRAIEEQRPVLSENVPLVQGGEAFVYRKPIYIEGKFWGLLSTVIDAQPLLEAMFAQGNRSDTPFEFAVRSGEESSSLMLWGPGELFDDPESVIIASDRGWEYAVKRTEADSHWLPIFILRILGWVLALVLGLVTYSALLHRSVARQSVPGQ